MGLADGRYFMVACLITFWWTSEITARLDPVAVMKDDISRIKSMMQAVGDQLERFNSLYETKLENRLLNAATSIAHIDSNVKNLQERAHVWDTFKFQVSAWNDHIRSLDTKLGTINAGAGRVELANEKLIALLPLDSKMAGVSERLEEADDKLADIQKRVGLSFASSVNSEFPLFSEFTSRGVLSSLKDIEVKLMRLVKTANSSNGRHLETHCPATERVIHDQMSNMAAKIDYIHDKVAVSSRQTREVADEDGYLQDERFQDSGSFWRQMVFPLRRANRRLENLDQTITKVQKIANLPNYNQKEKAAITSIQNNLAALHQCCTEEESHIYDVARLTENNINQLKNQWRNECITEARYNQRIQQFRNDLAQQLTENFQSIFAENLAELDRTFKGEKEMSCKNETTKKRKFQPKVNNTVAVVAKTIDTEKSVSISADFNESRHVPGCEDLLLAGETGNGVYKVSGTDDVNEAGRDYYARFCDMHTEGGGWTIIQRRGDYSKPRQNFSLSWVQYKEGFGDLNREFWFGNEYIHKLTTESDMILRIELWDFDDNFAYAEYETFRVDTEEELYRLWIEGYQGNATDSLGSHNGYAFSTHDQDNDEAPPCCPCAATYGGGWWFYSCFEANLNGEYMDDPTDNDVFHGIIWEFWKGDYSLKRTEMKLRPRSFNPPVSKPENLQRSTNQTKDPKPSL